jgi:8-oxo-dGTP pyrophosphatase MutT (NUDIX family)
MSAPNLDLPGADVTPVPAATVVIVRDGEQGIETWMMRRVKAMAFAPGAAVFPGGRVDPRDADISVPWLGSDPDRVAARLQTDARTSRELVTAALRELFEETSVLLAHPLPDIDLEQARVAIESREFSLAQFLADHGCALSADALHPWARWVTPAVERRRYDTWFFVATLPVGSEAQAVSSEADVAGWIAVEEVLRAYAAREMLVLPPTVTMLRGLAAAGTVAQVLAAAPQRSLVAVHPQLTLRPDGSTQLLADGAEFIFPAASAGATP